MIKQPRDDMADSGACEAKEDAPLSQSEHADGEEAGGDENDIGEIPAVTGQGDIQKDVRKDEDEEAGAEEAEVKAGEQQEPNVEMEKGGLQLRRPPRAVVSPWRR